MDSLYVLVVLGAVAAGFVQGLSGFGFGMVAMSFWAWTIDPRLAAAMTVFGALTGQLLAAFTVRRGFSWSNLLPFVLGGLVGIPIGVKVLPHLDPLIFKTFIGGLLAVWCPIMLFATRLPRITAGGKVADGVVGAMGGIMGGIGGFTGVIPTLWCTLRGFERDVQRSVIQNFNLSMLAVTMASYIVTGVVTTDMLPLFAIIVPAMLVPTLLGARVYVGISDVTFRRVVLGLLTLSGIALLVSSVPKLFA
ncbi:sulfite exporter TauE/SafE family protein [Achromobacter sp. LC458]|uniref:Probable membrane transporter protein n=1 Tax=Achromobacter spanius TaxID=217203 RepID=A0A2S5GJZ7_9BURK|nr:MULTISPECIES: sulfite exporter TauE/SafE family protein [Achromobacter]AYD64068.1 sulfite exporter TauE/SafE family protein [Achromobacter sp. B7]MDX3985869.1 sulfite exporter TauE/SafE family protein [Achromobacter sp.]PPA73417.1 sulfite exporter TauE/SafE family protein [Achromobacter spanius]QYJ23520.1 sulfite exporter TauE/SafE family protein [Achromobacter sp. ES-001]TRM49867.1 sulfite exporter TauE/SafE family protein [Achromobacter sp. LC458]